ncbi:MAG: ABC transporter permease [Clostridia bacterium]|nr:ABC transporter permease [Clostridia bacterium]
MSEEHKRYLSKLKRKRILIKLVQIGILILLFGLWELFAHVKIIDPFLTSSPSRVVQSISNLYESGMLFRHLGATLLETVISFLLSTVIGTLIAIILWWNETVRRISEPYIIVLNALPKIALGPLIIIWAGAGRNAIIVMALLICVIITIISMLTGFMSIDKGKMQLMKSMKATKLQTLCKLILPGNIPTLISVLKINVGLSWVGTIMGEYLVSREGIGYLLVYGSQIFRLDLVMASTIMLCILATAMYLGVSLVEKLIHKYY